MLFGNFSFHTFGTLINGHLCLLLVTAEIGKKMILLNIISKFGQFNAGLNVLVPDFCVCLLLLRYAVAGMCHVMMMILPLTTN